MVTTESKVSALAGPFVNTALTDFSAPASREAQAAALRQVEAEFGHTYPLIIGGDERMTTETFTSTNPARPEQVVARFAKATPTEAAEAVEAAWERFQTWRYTPAAERAGYLGRAAELLRERRFYFNALMVYEVGKSWVEADADTAEAIDFLEFYAREALRLGEPQPVTQILGEKSTLTLHSSGSRRRDPSLEFPLRYHGRSDYFRAGRGQYRYPQAGKHRSLDRRPLCGSPRRCGCASRRS